MKILVAPLNWGLGHASRCIPLIQRFIDEGHEVILGGDGDSLTLLRRHFPKLRYVYLAPLHLRYSKGNRQVWAILKALPHILYWSIKDHSLLRAVLREEAIDRVVSDNRFGLYATGTECIYITHQLHIILPKGWRWLEPTVERLHTCIYRHYDKVWVPDFEDKNKNLGGHLSHPTYLRANIEYIGPLSRFYMFPRPIENTPAYDILAILSGLEPQRSLLEAEIVNRYAGKQEKVLIVQGLLNRPNTRIKRSNITMAPYLEDAELARLMILAKHIIARSGYSTIMDLYTLDLLRKAELIPTPGQPEQEYLASKLLN